MDRQKRKRKRYRRRKLRVRKKVFGVGQQPRLTVFRSCKHIYAQIIDDAEGKTLLAASSRGKDAAGQLRGGGNVEAAKAVGGLLGQKAVAAGIGRVVFDRNGYKYHGRVRALAEAVREAGVTF